MMQAGCELCGAALEGVEANPETIRSGEYPVCNPTYVMVDSRLSADAPARRLYDWLLSEDGQRLVAAEGYVSVMDFAPERKEAAPVTELGGRWEGDWDGLKPIPDCGKDNKKEKENIMGSLKNLDTILENFVKEGGPAGAGLRVYRGDDCVYERFLGMADESKAQPFAADSICQLASMTKCIAVTAAMQLYEQGKFLLTDPVEQYIPEFANRQVYETTGRGEVITRPAKSPVTVGNLFDMTSGITINWNWPNPNSKALSAATERLSGAGKYNVQEFAKVCGQIPGAFDPGTHFFYGQSHDILGALIEVITGMHFGDYLRKNIFEPLGMEDTFFFVPEEKKDRCAAMYALKDGKRVPGRLPDMFFEPDFESACGGLYGTVEDYSRFARCMTLGEWNGVRLLGNRTIDLMRMNRLCPEALKDFTNAYLSGYGYGLGVRTRMDASAGSNSSVGEFGWTGGWGTWVLMDPAEKLSIVYAHQLMPNLEEYIHPRIRNIVYSAL